MSEQEELNPSGILKDFIYRLDEGSISKNDPTFRYFGPEFLNTLQHHLQTVITHTLAQDPKDENPVARPNLDAFLSMLTYRQELLYILKGDTIAFGKDITQLIAAAIGTNRAKNMHPRYAEFLISDITKAVAKQLESARNTKNTFETMAKQGKKLSPAEEKVN